MPRPSPYLRFLLRGSVLIAATLAIWWTLLLYPMMWVLREAAAWPLGLISGMADSDPIALDAAGDWVFRIAVDGGPARPSARQVNSIEFTTPRSDIVLFTVSVPLLWAILLAVPATRRTVWPMLLGTLIVASVEVLSLVVFVELMGHSFVAEGHPAATGVSAWLRELTHYLVVNVIPELSPAVVALAVYPDLRSRVFSPEARA